MAGIVLEINLFIISTIIHLKNSIKSGIVFLLLLFITGCSIKKNTWTSRVSQATVTRFNVYYNGAVSYKEGIESIRLANVEDYSTIISMYPISKHSNATAATSAMDRTIEKCRKAIKLHSIKVKPEKNYKKINSPEYKLYYSQQEFNPALKEAWLLLAQAEFHKGDFIGSAATFSYISRLYVTDKEMVTRCQLWIARAYGEVNWLYEADEVMSKLDQNSVKGSLTSLYASVNADLLLKKKLYKDAIPFLKLALKDEKDKFQKQRFSYLLAQLYNLNGDYKAAYDGFADVVKSNPSYEMDFNARISRAQITHGDVASVQKDLRKMLKNKNNAEYLDQIYYALGNTYINSGDTVNAIKNYNLSTDKSTRNGIDKAITLMRLGDLHYYKNNYVAAQPCYEAAAKIITVENENFQRVSKRAEVLGELVTQHNIVVLQDSLQKLSLLSEKERLVVVNKIIAKLIEDEKTAADNERKKTNEEFGDEFANLTPIGGNMPGAIGDWYFYNIGLMRTGESDFRKKWGKRKLEDNWRRSNKAVSLFAEETNVKASNGENSVDSVQKTDAVSDFKKPEFYLAQIPVTSAQIEKSNSEIATAMFNEGFIYKDKIEDLPLALNSFQSFITRFPADKRVPDSYYNIYLIQSKLGKIQDAERTRQKLVSDYPTSEYAIILSQPDYLKRMESMYKEQDSIYVLTYKAYNDSKYDKVIENATFFQKNYPLSSLLPKFLFLQALSIGKSTSADKFETALSDLITKYPESDVSSMSKDILALVKQGQKTKVGTTSGTLLVKRDAVLQEEIKSADTQQFSTEKKSKHRLMLVGDNNLAISNKLLYNVASFNFSRFMIKDFELVVNKLDSLHSALSVTNFESHEEADWYEKTLATDYALSQLIKDSQIRPVIISEANFALIRTSLTLDDYLAFAKYPTVEKLVAKPSSTSQVTTKKTEKTVMVTPELKKQEAVRQEKVKQETPVESKSKVDALQPKQDLSIVPKQNKVANADVSTKTPAVAGNIAPTVTVQPKVEEPPVPLFKGLFGYKLNEPHYVAIYVISGTVDFEKTKSSIDAYNAKNYSLLNLKVTMETVGNQKIIIIGSLNDANIAKSYLLRMVKESSLFEGLKSANYRNLIGSQKNLNVLMQQNALNVYFEFMKEYYLK